MVQRTLDKLQLKTPLESWDNETIEKVVNAFTDEKFPTVCALNKIDHADADKNIAKIAKKQDPNSIVLTSAISEVFLRKLAKQGYIRYTEGSEFVDTREDLIEGGDPDGGGLKEMDEKLKVRIENLKDMVLYRFGSTGVVQVLSRAAQLLGLVPVFPVRNMHSYTAGTASGGVFRDCVLVPKYVTTHIYLPFFCFFFFLFSFCLLFQLRIVWGLTVTGTLRCGTLRRRSWGMCKLPTLRVSEVSGLLRWIS